MPSRSSILADTKEDILTTSAIPFEVETVKTRLKSIWMAGDYDRFSWYVVYGEQCTRFLRAPTACSDCRGRWSEVTGVDIASNLVERARARTQAEGLRARFQEADAEALPFEDASFDVVASLIGAMFAPRPDLVARELLRVCKPGGTIAMVNWTPQGFVGQMFNTVSKFIAPSGMPSPVLWGDEITVRERLR